LSLALLKTHGKQVFFVVRVTRRAANARGPPPSNLPRTQVPGRSRTHGPKSQPSNAPWASIFRSDNPKSPKIHIKTPAPLANKPYHPLLPRSPRPRPAASPTRRRPALASLPPGTPPSLPLGRRPPLPRTRGIRCPPSPARSRDPTPFLSRHAREIRRPPPPVCAVIRRPLLSGRRTRDPPPPLLAAHAGIRHPLPFSAMAMRTRKTRIQ
jgi:hypothetical protein